MKPDGRTLRRICHRLDAAGQVVVVSLRGLAVGLARKFRRGRPWIELEDLVQAALIGVCIAVAKGAGRDGDLNAYARKWAWFQLKRHYPYRPLGRSLDWQAPSGDDIKNVLADPGQPEPWSEVDAAPNPLSLLTPRQAEYFRLRFEQGLTVQEVADRVGVSKQRVSQVINAGRERLGRLLARKE